METIINKKDATEDQRRDAIYIGRSGMIGDECYGNPFSHLPNTLAAVRVATREHAIEAYELWLRGTGFDDIEQQRRQWVLAHLMDLQGKTLMCHCAPLECHGTVLVRLLHEQLDDLIRSEALERDYDIEETLAEEREEAEHWNSRFRRGEL